ncbi:MAG: histidinol-phosphate transaminase [Candidatus Methylomirabilales bacterium]
MSDPALGARIGGRADLADLRPYRAPQLDAPVKLNTNESPYPPPESFLNDLAERIASLRLNRYPIRDFPAVREALAARLGTFTERVWLANGSNEIILQLLLAFGGADRRALTFEPTYTMHSHIARVSGTRLLTAPRNPDFTLEPGACLQALEAGRPEVVFLCSPNNPTGNADRKEEVERICSAAPGLVILDEAYAEFSGGSLLPLVEDFDHLVVVRSFSKAWRMAGARLGYLVARPWVIDQVLKVRLPYHLSSLTQAAALLALAHAGELTAIVETMCHERERLWRELSTTRGIVAFPSEANFLLFRCESKPAGQVWQRLLDHGVLVRDFSDLRGCEGCLRVSVGTPQQNERFLDALSDSLAR